MIQWLKSMRIAAIVLFIAGSVLFGIGLSMRIKQNSITTLEQEVVKGDEVFVKGNKNKMAVVGGVTGVAVGAATGAGVGTAIGGMGLTLCGTGIGIPLGAMVIRNF